jgi:hypothetical protein
MKHIENSLNTLIGSIALMFVLSVSAVSASVPSFVSDGTGLYASNSAQVINVSDSADIAVVHLDNGLDAGLDIGMTASVYRGVEKIGTVILVATEQYQSAALILELNESRVIEAGDYVQLNTFRNS